MDLGDIILSEVRERKTLNDLYVESKNISESIYKVLIVAKGVGACGVDVLVVDELFQSQTVGKETGVYPWRIVPKVQIRPHGVDQIHRHDLFDAGNGLQGIVQRHG